MKRLATAGLVAAGLWAGGIARADELAEKIRRVAERHEGALAILKGVVAVTISAQGQSQEQEVPVEFPALALDRPGLFVSANPENQNAYQGNFRNIPGIQVEVRGKDYRLVTSDGKETAARIEGVDSEYGLAFLKAEEALPAVKAPALKGGGGLNVGDPFVMLRLLSSTRPEVVAALQRVDYRFEKPAPMFRFTSMATPNGAPVFDLEGNLVGLTCIYQEVRPGAQPMGHQVVLPVARLAELVAGVAGPPAESDENK